MLSIAVLSRSRQPMRQCSLRLKNRLSQFHPAIARRGSSTALIVNIGGWMGSQNLWDPSVEQQQQQVRWKRNDSLKKFYKPRPPTRKQRKEYNRRMKRLEWQRTGRHGKPGSKAGPRREYAEQTWQNRLEAQKESSELALADDDAYTKEDAMLDSLMGNTSYLTSQENPEPLYLGHKHRFYFNRVADQMEAFRDYQHQQKSMQEGPLHHDNALMDPVGMPSDRDISLVLRAYRDRHGTKNKPIGIAKALEHLLKDLGISTYAFGDRTYSTLLTCCRTPVEAGRIVQLMKDNNHPLNSYSWSILVDIHARVGDFEGCHHVMNEMAANDIPPNKAAYTSLLAGCYKVVNDGRIAKSIRAKAGTLAWEKWQEMRILGLEHDVMSYGAILRILAARGRAERALSILDEMPVFDVKPTTLCFTSALKAVSRSHEISLRYERGRSFKNRRREYIAAWHGKLARQIVIQAEAAEVDLDDGFMAALMMCAATAGDSATAKAIYLASKVRKLDHLRTIGSDSHLAMLRGEKPQEEPLRIAHGTGSAIATVPEHPSLQKRSKYPSFEEREYGTDTRMLSALLYACSRAVDHKELGTMWQGSEQNGYLCVNSLRMLTARPRPKYRDTSVPGLSQTEAGLTAMTYKEEREYRGKKRRRHKFQGLEMDEDVGNDVDTLDPVFWDMYFYPDGRRKDRPRPEELAEQQKQLDFSRNGMIEDGDDLHPELGAGLTKAMEPDGADITDMTHTNHRMIYDEATASWKSSASEKSGTEAQEMYFDKDLMEWKSGTKIETPEPGRAANGIPSQEIEDSAANAEADGDDDDEEEEMYFDYDAMKWKTRKKSEAALVAATEASVEPKSDTNEVAPKNDVEDRTDMYFDYDSMRWKPKPTSAEDSELTDFEAKELSKAYKNEKNQDTVAKKSLESQDPKERAYQNFKANLLAEIAASGDDVDVVDEEVRELFGMMSGEFPDVDVEELFREAAENDDDEEDEDEDMEGFESLTKGLTDEQREDLQNLEKETDFEEFLDSLKDEWKAQGVDVDQIDGKTPASASQPAATPSVPYGVGGTDAETQYGEPMATMPKMATDQDQYVPDFGVKDVSLTEFSEKLQSNNDVIQSGQNNLQMGVQVAGDRAVGTAGDYAVETEDPVIAELAQVLPGLPKKRLKKIRKAFEGSLGYPPMVELVPILRERMPEFLDMQWLTKSNLRNADLVIQKAAEDGVIDTHLLNGVLQVVTSAGKLDRAVEIHQDEFPRHKLTPTEYSDRLILQMMVTRDRWTRALDFKRAVEQDGRVLDLQSYGSLVDYCGRKKQLGSALLLLKECINIHGAPPGEKMLAKVRLLCRQQDLTDQVGLTDMIGEDPLAWLRHGEANLKREMSKKGRRDVLLPQAAMLRV